MHTQVFPAQLLWYGFNNECSVFCYHFTGWFISPQLSVHLTSLNKTQGNGLGMCIPVSQLINIILDMLSTLSLMSVVVAVGFLFRRRSKYSFHFAIKGHGTDTQSKSMKLVGSFRVEMKLHSVLLE